MQCKGQYLSADAGSVSEGSFSAFFSFSSWKQTGITLRTAACHISIFSLYHRIPSDVLKLDFLALHGGDWLSVAIKCLFCFVRFIAIYPIVTPTTALGLSETRNTSNHRCNLMAHRHWWLFSAPTWLPTTGEHNPTAKQSSIVTSIVLVQLSFTTGTAQRCGHWLYTLYFSLIWHWP